MNEVCLLRVSLDSVENNDDASTMITIQIQGVSEHLDKNKINPIRDNDFNCKLVSCKCTYIELVAMIKSINS